jgi:hypothetical protein
MSPERPAQDSPVTLFQAQVDRFHIRHGGQSAQEMVFLGIDIYIPEGFAGGTRGAEANGDGTRSAGGDFLMRIRGLDAAAAYRYGTYPERPAGIVPESETVLHGAFGLLQPAEIPFRGVKRNLLPLQPCTEEKEGYYTEPTGFHKQFQRYSYQR